MHCAPRSLRQERPNPCPDRLADANKVLKVPACEGTEEGVLASPGGKGSSAKDLPGSALGYPDKGQATFRGEAFQTAVGKAPDHRGP